jgi:hypothetical protein
MTCEYRSLIEAFLFIRNHAAISFALRDADEEASVHPQSIADGLAPGLLDNFQPSLRDLIRSLTVPSTACWAKFSRPFGTQFEEGSYHAGA